MTSAYETSAATEHSGGECFKKTVLTDLLSLVRADLHTKGGICAFYCAEVGNGKNRSIRMV